MSAIETVKDDTNHKVYNRAAETTMRFGVKNVGSDADADAAADVDDDVDEDAGEADDFDDDYYYPQPVELILNDCKTVVELKTMMSMLSIWQMASYVMLSPMVLEMYDVVSYWLV